MTTTPDKPAVPPPAKKPAAPTPTTTTTTTPAVDDQPVDRPALGAKLAERLKVEGPLAPLTPPSPPAVDDAPAEPDPLTQEQKAAVVAAVTGTPVDQVLDALTEAGMRDAATVADRARTAVMASLTDDDRDFIATVGAIVPGHSHGPVRFPCVDDEQVERRLAIVRAMPSPKVGVTYRGKRSGVGVEVVLR